MRLVRQGASPSARSSWPLALGAAHPNAALSCIIPRLVPSPGGVYLVYVLYGTRNVLSPIAYIFWLLYAHLVPE